MKRFRGGLVVLTILLAFALIAIVGCGGSTGDGVQEEGPPVEEQGGEAIKGTEEEPVEEEVADGEASAGERPLADWDNIENGPVFKRVLVPMALERIEAGTLTELQADYLFYLQIEEGKFPRGAEKGFEYALDNPDEYPVPDGWDGPRYIEGAK